MAKTLCEDFGECEKCTLSNPECENPCMIKDDCERLYNQGYRKASEREREIFEKIENNIKYNISLIEAMIFESEKIREAKLQCYRDFLGYLGELKKEYIGEDINDRTSTEES